MHDRTPARDIDFSPVDAYFLMLQLASSAWPHVRHILAFAACIDAAAWHGDNTGAVFQAYVGKRRLVRVI